MSRQPRWGLSVAYATCALALVATTACDKVFGFHDHEVTVDAALDAPPAPDAPDASPCGPNGHDEDADGIPDACDDCPVDSDPGQDDQDSDSVGDACDPAPGTPGDTILFFSAFTGSTGYVFNGNLTQTSDAIQLRGTTTVTVNGDLAPTRVRAGVHYAAPVANDLIEVFAGQAAGHIDRCIVDNADSACMSGQPCVGASVDNFNPTVQPWGNLPGTDTLILDAEVGRFACTVRAGGQMARVESTPATVLPGKVGLFSLTMGSDAAIVEYLIVYGR